MGIYDKMDEFEKNKVTIHKGANTVHGLFGYGDPIELHREALKNKKLGSLLAFEKVLEDMGADNAITIVLLIDMIMGKQSENGVGDVLEYLNNNFTEDELVEFVGMTVKGRFNLKGKR